MKNASKGKDPNVLCYMNEEVIILAPRIMGPHCIGLLIACEPASSRIVTLYTHDKVDEIRVRIPVLGGKVVAIENCYLDIVG